MGTCHPFYHCLIECSHSGNIVVSGLASEVENYISYVQDQELPTKFLKNKRDRDSGKNPSCNHLTSTKSRRGNHQWQKAHVHCLRGACHTKSNNPTNHNPVNYGSHLDPLLNKLQRKSHTAGAHVRCLQGACHTKSNNLTKQYLVNLLSNFVIT